jgi:hypothetical protein
MNLHFSRLEGCYRLNSVAKLPSLGFVGGQNLVPDFGTLLPNLRDLLELSSSTHYNYVTFEQCPRRIDLEEAHVQGFGSPPRKRESQGWERTASFRPSTRGVPSWLFEVGDAVRFGLAIWKMPANCGALNRDGDGLGRLVM